MKGLYEIADLLRHRARKRHMTADHALGRRGEDIAHRFLQRAGMVIVERNYRMASGAGEVDLIGWEAGTLVFVEVKSRKTEEYGAPDRAIGVEKQSSLIRAAREYARHAEVPWEKVRFDVVNVVFCAPPTGDAFSGGFRRKSALIGWLGVDGRRQQRAVPRVRGAVEEKAGGPFRLYGFEQTSARICPSFYAYDGRALAHAVGHLRAVMQLERIQRPVGIGHHANLSFSGNENGHVRGSVAGLNSALGGFQDLRGVV